MAHYVRVDGEIVAVATDEQDATAIATGMTIDRDKKDKKVTVTKEYDARDIEVYDDRGELICTPEEDYLVDEW
jgi:hypothetical protein